MSLGDRVGIAGLIVALFSIAAVYLWPDKKWIGWFSLIAAVGLILLWGWLELEVQAANFFRTAPVASTVTAFLLGGTLAASAWLWLAKRPLPVTRVELPSASQPQATPPIPAPPKEVSKKPQVGEPPPKAEQPAQPLESLALLGWNIKNDGKGENPSSGPAATD